MRFERFWRAVSNLPNSTIGRSLLAVLLTVVCIAPVVWAISDVVTRDANQTPCPAIDDSTGECRNLRYNNATKGLDVNVVGGVALSVGAIVGASTPTDAFANPTTAILNQSFGMGYNEATWDRTRTASATNLTIGTQIGSLLHEKGARWGVNHAPSAGTVAVASKSAGAGGVRHVADCVSYSMGAASAPTAATATVVLRDGSSGAGTILWQKQLPAPASTGVHANESFCGLNLAGSAATAMTLEFLTPFALIGLTNEVVTVNLSGFDVN